MSATKQTYTVTPNWTNTQLADIFKDAFIDAGLMVDWFDSFQSGGVQNRILEIAYDNTKAYGKTYYWFKFSTDVIGLNIATGWNSTTHLPIGTQYLDYYDTVTNQNGFYWSMGILSTGGTSVTVDLLRYTSVLDANQTWFVVRTGSSNYRCFNIVHPGTALQTWIDLDRGYYGGYHSVVAGTYGTQGRLSWSNGPLLRREVIKGSGLVGATSWDAYLSASTNDGSIGYAGIGNQTDNYGNFNTDNNWIFLPIGFSSTNPGYPGDSNPVFHSMAYSPYITDPLSSDFGITFHYASNSFNLEDTFVVDPGIEEWEVLSFANNSSIGTSASPLFLARIVGGDPV